MKLERRNRPRLAPVSYLPRQEYAGAPEIRPHVLVGQLPVWDLAHSRAAWGAALLASIASSIFFYEMGARSNPPPVPPASLPVPTATPVLTRALPARTQSPLPYLVPEQNPPAVAPRDESIVPEASQALRAEAPRAPVIEQRPLLMEPMVEHALAKPKLKPLPSLSAFARATAGSKGFVRLEMPQKAFWNGTPMADGARALGVSSYIRPAPHAQAPPAAGAAEPAPQPRRTFRGLAPGHAPTEGTLASQPARYQAAEQAPYETGPAPSAISAPAAPPAPAPTRDSAQPAERIGVAAAVAMNALGSTAGPRPAFAAPAPVSWTRAPSLGSARGALGGTRAAPAPAPRTAQDPPKGSLADKIHNPYAFFPKLADSGNVQLYNAVIHNNALTDLEKSRFEAIYTPGSGYTPLTPLEAQLAQSVWGQYSSATEARVFGTRIEIVDPYAPWGDGYLIFAKNASGSFELSWEASPLVFDLKSGGVRASDRWVRYDLAGNGRYQRLRDIASTNGVLVFDPRHTGLAGKNGRELFGDRTDLDGTGRPTGFKDGFEALEALVLKAEREGVLPKGTRTHGRLGRKELARLGKAYGLGMRVGSLLAKTVTLEQAGVKEIRLSSRPSRRVRNFDGQGNEVLRREGAVFARTDGTVGGYEDVFFQIEQVGLEKISLKN